MKIAVVTDDEKTVCQHFGRASLYMVYTVEDGKIAGKEKRAKFGHNQVGGHGHEGGQGGPHGFDAAAQDRHTAMADAIRDCRIVIAGGMGMGAYYSLKNAGIEPVATDVDDLEQAVKLYAEGKLPTREERFH